MVATNMTVMIRQTGGLRNGSVRGEMIDKMVCFVQNLVVNAPIRLVF